MQCFVMERNSHYIRLQHGDKKKGYVNDIRIAKKGNEKSFPFFVILIIFAALQSVYMHGFPQSTCKPGG